MYLTKQFAYDGTLVEKSGKIIITQVVFMKSVDVTFIEKILNNIFQKNFIKILSINQGINK